MENKKLELLKAWRSRKKARGILLYHMLKMLI
jgi:hypothetical protein